MCRHPFSPQRPEKKKEKKLKSLSTNSLARGDKDWGAQFTEGALRAERKEEEEGEHADVSLAREGGPGLEEGGAGDVERFLPAL